MCSLDNGVPSQITLQPVTAIGLRVKFTVTTWPKTQRSAINSYGVAYNYSQKSTERKGDAFALSVSFTKKNRLVAHFLSSLIAKSTKRL